MKKHYQDINELKAMLENIINKQVKHYKTDWTDYDLPKLEKCIASNNMNEKNLTLIARNSGTWLLFTNDLRDPGSQASIIFNYYLPGSCGASKKTPEKYYNIDLSALTIIQLKFDQNGKIITARKRKTA